MLLRRVEKLERGDDAGAVLVGVVVMDGEVEADRIAAECARRKVNPERAFVAVVRVPQVAESVEAAKCKHGPATPPPASAGRHHST